MGGSWDALFGTTVTSSQRQLRSGLVAMLKSCALPHLKPEHVTLSSDGEVLELLVRHARCNEQCVRARIEPDGSGWLDCEVLEPEFHIDFDARDHAFAVEAVALLLHGWATVEVETRADGRHQALVTIDSPSGEAFLVESYETRSSLEGQRTVSWASRAERAEPPRLPNS